jgi:hypothetical protein
MKMRRSTASIVRTQNKETPFYKLPRQGVDINIEAERQGFDDGYFGNNKLWGNIDTFDIYLKSFKQGQEQRAATDRATRRKIKP